MKPPNSFSRDRAGDSYSVVDVRVWDDRRRREAWPPVVSLDRGLDEGAAQGRVSTGARPGTTCSSTTSGYQSFTEKVDALTADDLSVTLHAAITMRPIARGSVLPRSGGGAATGTRSSCGRSSCLAACVGLSPNTRWSRFLNGAAKSATRLRP